MDSWRRWPCGTTCAGVEPLAKGVMLDLAYLALGLGVLALFGLYAAALRRL
jgi:hypothetical protein